ncbi:MAG TPA: FTR1 family protein [Roseiflexaceae bacterium]|nr:FTR1 family protein [Roseiflexaceae bacterium]
MPRFCLLICCVLALLASPLAAGAQTPAPSEQGEAVRSALVQAQLLAASDQGAARRSLDEARAAYAALAATLADSAPAAAGRAEDGFVQAERAVGQGDPVAFAAARAQIWTALLDGSAATVAGALERGDAATARAWLPLREFRHATRFSRPGTDATVAVAAAAAGRMAPAEALAAVRADLLDTYQARLTAALHDAQQADRQGFAQRRAEAAALAEGYLALLGPVYQEQRGPDALAQLQRLAADLRAAAAAGQALDGRIAPIEQALQGFRAAPLSLAEQTRRAGQLLRFLALVPVEYERGIRNGQVVSDLEIREAVTFRDGAAAAFNDLRTLLDARDAPRTAQAAETLHALEQHLAAASTHSAVADPGEIQRLTDELLLGFQTLMPQEWQRRDSSADFDVIQTALDQMEAAVVAGQYEQAESARLEAYAILESGPEAKLVVFAPQFKPLIEGLFWYGEAERPGLAQLLRDRAPLAQIQTTRAALNVELAAAQKALAGNNAPVAVATNAAVIVFREGLEAVLILASLMGSLKIGTQRRFRTPLWAGAGLALAATALTWLLARGLLTTLARYGERLEAVVSLIAIAVLLLITNWFFHDVYWKGWMSSFHQQKRRIIGGVAGQMIGLVTLGFTSIYREGFETVLFLQALVLESGNATVLSGVAVGLLGTFLIGLLVFVVQAKLPHKKMLIFTGILIGVVLLQMVGNTVHVLQVVGWLPTHPIRWLTPLLPYWTGLWFGLYATWEGILFQFAAGAFTIGSYFLAEYMNKREAAAVTVRQAVSQS